MPIIKCTFNHSYEIFLNDLFDYVIAQHGKLLELSKLQTIEMVRSLPGNSDGRMVDEHSIQISSRLYEQLPTLEIHSLYDKENFKLILKTLFHELCHISEIKTMPKIHEYGFSQEGTDCMVALFWIEYIAESKTCSVTGQHIDELCIMAAKNRWEISKLNFDEADCCNFFYLTKVLPYVISRVRAANAMRSYLRTVKNPILQSMIYELNNEVIKLEGLYPFDSIDILNGIHRIFEIYWDFFMRRKLFISKIPTSYQVGISD